MAGLPPPAPASANVPSAERHAASTLFAASVLALSGGILDAFLYLNHGHVFAGAMTGNAILCGIALLGHDRHEALHHALPLFAFFVGVWLAEALQSRARHHAVTIGLACEAGGLLIASFVPGGFPDLVFVPIIVVLAAYQIASFRRVDRFAYNSTFITGDLRTLVVGLHQALRPECRTDGLQQARDLGLVVGSFLAGATVGAVLAPRAANHTLWLPAALLCLVLIVAWRRATAAQATELAGAPAMPGELH